jgi:uncharacterized membrane protein
MIERITGIGAFDGVMLVVALTALGLVVYLALAVRNLRRLQREDEMRTTSTATRAEAERLLRLARELSRDSFRQEAPGPADEPR